MLSCSFKLPPRLQTRPLPNSFLGDSAIRLTTKTRKKESKKKKKRKKRRRARRRRRRRRLCSDTTRRGVDELMERSVKRFSARYLFLRLFSLNSLPYLISRPVFPTFSFFFSSLRSSLLHARLDAESERRLKGLIFFLNSPSVVGFSLSIFLSSSLYRTKCRNVLYAFPLLPL